MSDIEMTEDGRGWVAKDTCPLCLSELEIRVVGGSHFPGHVLRAACECGFRFDLPDDLEFRIAAEATINEVKRRIGNSKIYQKPEPVDGERA